MKRVRITTDCRKCKNRPEHMSTTNWKANNRYTCDCFLGEGPRNNANCLKFILEDEQQGSKDGH